MKKDIYICDGCGFEDDYSNLPAATKLSMRVTPGGNYTDVECPECGALCFPAPAPKKKKRGPAKMTGGSKKSHAPEPWERNADGDVFSGSTGETLICADYADKTNPANLDRAISCVNGCKGMLAPEEDVPALVGMLSHVLARYDEMNTELEGGWADDGKMREARDLLVKVCERVL